MFIRHILNYRVKKINKIYLFVSFYFRIFVCMIVKKKVINTINKSYMKLIKDLYNNNLNVDIDIKEHYIICTKLIANKKVEFHIKYGQDRGESAYVIWADYYPRQIKRKYIITIYVTLQTEEFKPNLFGEINLRVKSLIYHEIEHHLQRIKVPFRAHLDLKAYTGKTIDYINSDAEIEAYAKQYYFLHRQSKIGFHTLLNLEAKNIAMNPLLRLRFKKKIYKFIRQRKDLNLLLNIQI